MAKRRARLTTKSNCHQRLTVGIGIGIKWLWKARNIIKRLAASRNELRPDTVHFQRHAFSVALSVAVHIVHRDEQTWKPAPALAGSHQHKGILYQHCARICTLLHYEWWDIFNNISSGSSPRLSEVSLSFRTIELCANEQFHLRSPIPDKHTRSPIDFTAFHSAICSLLIIWYRFLLFLDCSSLWQQCRLRWGHRVWRTAYECLRTVFNDMRMHRALHAIWT